MSLRPATVRSYAALTRDYLVPYLGLVPLEALTAADVQGMFTAIVRDGGVLGRPVSAATLQRIHVMLRAGLNSAVRAGLIPANPGRFPDRTTTTNTGQRKACRTRREHAQTARKGACGALPASPPRAGPPSRPECQTQT